MLFRETGLVGWRKHRASYYLSHDDRPGDLPAYLDSLLTELRLYVDASALADRELDFVYFGGGTPSLLSADRLERLLSRMQWMWSWGATREVTFECAPSSVTPAKLELLRGHGIPRISLGVQEVAAVSTSRNRWLRRS